MNFADTLTAGQVENAIKKAMPGFESRILIDSRTHLVTVEARGPVWFFGEVAIDPYVHPLATNDANEVFAEQVLEMIRTTRAHAIEQLGLDEEIRLQVEEKTRQAVAAAKDEWERKGWERGYAAAYAAAARNIAEGLAAQLGEEE